MFSRRLTLCSADLWVARPWRVEGWLALTALRDGRDFFCHATELARLRYTAFNLRAFPGHARPHYPWNSCDRNV
jgi:hypothetical protein